MPQVERSGRGFRGWQITVIVVCVTVVFLTIVGLLVGTEDPQTAGSRSDSTTTTPASQSDSSTTAASPAPTTAAPPTNPPPPTSPPTTAPPPTAPPTTARRPSGETVSQRNARQKAADYLDFTSFSRSGLIDQLLFEGFTPAQAEFGVSRTGL